MKIRNHGARQRGFTLIEIMVVVIVLGILAAIIIPNFASKPEEARVAKAKTDISSLCTLLEQYRLDMGKYPTEEEGLDVLRSRPSSSEASRWKGPYSTKSIPDDPWGHPYRYYNPCPNNIDGYGIESYGADGQAGGKGVIQSWESESKSKGNSSKRRE